jgi:hypothetical protein
MSQKTNKSTHMKSFVKFMVNGAGRAVRIIAGLALIICGYFLFSVPNWIMIIIGLVPLSAGLFDFCLLAPLFGYFFSGQKTREAVSK